MNPKFNPYLLSKFLIFYHSSVAILYIYILCVGGSKASAGQYLDIARERGQYPDIAREGGFQLSLDPPFDPTFHL